MKLEVLNINHIQEASIIIDEHGVPKDNVWSQYYVVVNGREYPFKHLIRTAFRLATGDELNIQSNDSYRNYIESLDFDIRYYEGGYNFFTKEELEFYKSIVDTDYRKDNPEHRYYGQKLYPIIAKAKYWADQILIDGFKVRKEGNWLNGHVARIKPYFWPRIYSGEDKDIFFNVEVNGANQFIGYKLDGYYETTKSLPPHKIKLLDDYKELIKWQWPKISFDNLEDYNWEKLITESRPYVEKYLSHYNHLKKLLSKESKICRIVWNTNNWVKPSGRSGKSTYPSFENDNGFGHEEWLFDGDKIIDGHKYGFLEPINKYRSKYEGKLFNLVLYTRDADTNQDYWVATLNNVEVISPEEAEQVLEYYKSKGWYDEMKNDLFNLSLDANQLDNWVGDGAEKLFNIKFESIEINRIPSELIPVLNKNDISSNRYTLMDANPSVLERIKEIENSGFSFDNTGSGDAHLSSKSKRTSVNREIELELKHNIIQTKFLNYLQDKYGKENVKRECKAFGASRIDITRKTDSGYVFYEIKTYNSLKTSIREGIGQLLEYSLYPNVREAESLVLVSHVSPTEEVREYFSHLKQFINLPISYIHFDEGKEEIISEI